MIRQDVNNKNEPGVTFVAEASATGSDFVTISPSKYDYISRVSAEVGGPYVPGLRCKCGSVTVDNTCSEGGGLAPYFVPTKQTQENLRAHWNQHPWMERPGTEAGGSAPAGAPLRPSEIYRVLRAAPQGPFTNDG